ncbi:hypothetical protein PHMEG_00016244 [Phytophthora megakarya]|uniref:Bzip transcription factor n=1 Tax=Phytophthora megakarya TaxID=4795 RepID=A0A225VZ94_9STRA|nr:hypothetical protein PHMEG_00016244 [Phytophthora megakarya]
MARYRERWLAHEAGLVADVQRLTEDIMKLEVQRQFVAANAPTNMTCWSVVAEYFRLFQYAHKSPHNQVVDQSFRGPTDLNVYRQFIQSTMTANVLAESGCGMEAILEDYRLYSLYQPDLDHRVIHLENGFEDTIVATTRLKVKISAITLRYAFPQLVSDPLKWETLGKKLLGQKFTLRGSVEFKWDADIQRIVSIQRTVDILTPFLELLGNLEDVVSVFENAMVTPDCTLVLDDALPISTNTTVSES